MNENGKQIVAIDGSKEHGAHIISKKGLCPEGMFVRQGYSPVPATNTAIRRMIKEQTAAILKKCGLWNRTCPLRQRKRNFPKEISCWERRR